MVFVIVILARLSGLVLPYLTAVLRNKGITFILEYVHTYMCHVQVVQVYSDHTMAQKTLY